MNDARNAGPTWVGGHQDLDDVEIFIAMHVDIGSFVLSDRIDPLRSGTHQPRGARRGSCVGSERRGDDVGDDYGPKRLLVEALVESPNRGYHRFLPQDTRARAIIGSRQNAIHGS